MCYKVNCKDCKQYTWSGCGRHIKSALSGVEESDRCINWKLGSKSPCGQKTGASAGKSEAANKAPLVKPEPAVVAAGGKSGLFCCFT